MKYAIAFLTFLVFPFTLWLENFSKTMNNKKIIILSILILASIMLASCSKKSASITVHNLKILYTADASLNSVLNRNGWTPIKNPLYIDKSSISLDSFTHAWLKGEFIIGDDPSPYYGIYLKNDVGVIDTVYINTMFIGTKTIHRALDLQTPSHYRLPPTVLKKGKNYLYIYVGIPPMTKVNFTSYAQIQTWDDFDQTEFWNNLLYRQGLIGMMIILSSFIVMQLIDFLIDRKAKIRLLYALGLIVCNIILSSLLTRFEKINIELTVTFAIACIPAILIYLMFLIQSLYGIFLSNINRVAASLLLLFIIAIGAAINHLMLQSLLVIAAIVVALGCIGYMLHQLHNIKPKKFTLYFIIVGLVIMSATWLFQLLAPHFDVYYPRFSNMYQFLFYLLVTLIYEAYETKKQRLKIHRLYDKLKESKAPKTAKLTITDSSEEKLDRVIQFINENYTSDISREGLASAVDINPNYLSSLFNAYTGKKINEYINSLRIKEAAKQLAETDKKIIDIAFSTGFETLATFIRIFKNEMGTTPSEYRESLNQ